MRKDGSFGIEEVKVWGPNALFFQLQVGQEKENRWRCVGRYLPPLDKAGEAQRLLTAAIHAVPDGAWPMVLANLNADLDSPGVGRKMFWRTRLRARPLLRDQAVLVPAEATSHARAVDLPAPHPHARRGLTLDLRQIRLRTREGAGLEARAKLSLGSHGAPWQ